MSNIFCPISDERVDERGVRATALLTFVIALLFIIEPNIFAAAFLSFDFYARGFGMPQVSLLACSGHGLTRYFPFRSRIIDKAPKIFAARVGLVFSLIASLLLMADLELAAQIVIGILALFSLLEWSISFCLGCYVYSWVVLPLFKEK